LRVSFRRTVINIDKRIGPQERAMSQPPEAGGTICSVIVFSFCGVVDMRTL
jgi:hypothetical protein